MYVELVYPELTASEYVDTIQAVNSDISFRNNFLLIPQVIWLAFSASLYLVAVPVILLLWRLIFYVITAQEIRTILIGLTISVASVPIAFYLVKHFLSHIRDTFIMRLVFPRLTETFTFSPYVERSDQAKYANEWLNYYNMCDVLKQCHIEDISLDGDEDTGQCKVVISYTTGNSDKIKLMKLQMNYKFSTGTNVPVVDLERMNVIFPAKEGI